jgi:HSP20 family protein
MSTKALTRSSIMPSIFEDFFKPWSQWFDDSGLVNHYTVSLAAPGLKKEDFNIEVDGNVLTISSEKEESTEDKGDRYTRREYSYTSFSRSFTLPDDVKPEAIDARYEAGELKITLPRKENGNKASASKRIAVE